MLNSRYWRTPCILDLIVCNADKENTTEDTVVETTEDTGEVEDSDTQDTQEDTNVEDTGEVEEPPPPKIVRFVAMGDGGEGNETQYKVADVLKEVCEQKTDDLDGCEFVLYLGDNIYDVGVDDVLDEQSL